MNPIMQGDTHQKYDKSLEDDMSMYDNQPYKKDPDLCNTDMVRMVSGNIVKYYTFQYNWNEPYVVNTQDEAVEKRLASMRQEYEAAARQKVVSSPTQGVPVEATIGADEE